MYNARGNDAVNASGRFVLYQDLDGKTYDVELPLTSVVEPSELREELGCHHILT